jgi:hypothetical protein
MKKKKLLMLWREIKENGKVKAILRRFKKSIFIFLE